MFARGHHRGQLREKLGIEIVQARSSMSEERGLFWMRFLGLLKAHLGLSGGLFWGLFGGLGALGGLKLPHEQSRGAMTGSWGPLEGLRGLKQESWEGQKSSGESARAILDPPIESVLAKKGPQRALQEGSKRSRHRRMTGKSEKQKTL